MGTTNCKHATCQGETCRREKKPMAPRKAIPRTSLPASPRNWIPRHSKKRAKQDRKYTKLRKAFLHQFPDCQALRPGCMHEATEIHHMAGRIEDDLTDVDNFLAVCPRCHSWIETHPVEAKALCLSISRLQVTDQDRTIYAPEEHVA